MKVIQCSLTSLDGDSKMIAWLDKRPDLKAGVLVTLKGTETPDRLWRVVSVGSMAQEKSEMKRSDVFDSIKPKKP